METLQVFDIQRFSIHNGPGIRTTIFLSGCPLRCFWCHNPESFSKAPTNVMPIGDIVKQVMRDSPFYIQSGGGVTLSGGEPLMNPEGLMALCQGLTQENLHIALDTSGFADIQVIKSVAPLVNLFLYDLKCLVPALHYEATGAPLEPIVENYKFLIKSGANAWVRIPLVPSLSLNPESIEALLELLKHYPPARVDLLPIHNMAQHKYEKAALTFCKIDMTARDIMAVQNLKQGLLQLNIPVELNEEALCKSGSVS